MTTTGSPDLIQALERFLGAIEPYDPARDRPVASVELRAGHRRGTFQLTDRAVRALHGLLIGYTDPDNCGSCPHCGCPLDATMRCRGCGHVAGIFGETVARHAEDVARRQQNSEASASE